MLRLFIVGCPRSGTTLLQTVLLSSDRIVSFPESHFFEHLAGCPRRIPRGIYGQRLLHRWLDSTNLKYPKKFCIGFSRSSAIDYFWSTLDSIAIAESAIGWLEKTPGHVQHIKLIQDHVPDAKFIHIIRSYKDNVASFYLARKQWGNERSPLTTARDWFSHVSESLSYLHLENHFHISYEELVSHPRHVIDKLSSFLGLSFPNPDDIDLRHYAKQIVEKDAVWKANNLKSHIFSDRHDKYSEIFTEAERSEIEHYAQSISVWLKTVFDSEE